MAMVTLTDVMKIYRMGTVEVPALKGCPLPSRLGVLLPSWVRQDAVNRPSEHPRLPGSADERLGGH